MKGNDYDHGRFFDREISHYETELARANLNNIKRLGKIWRKAEAKSKIYLVDMKLLNSVYISVSIPFKIFVWGKIGALQRISTTEVCLELRARLRIGVSSSTFSTRSPSAPIDFASAT